MDPIGWLKNLIMTWGLERFAKRYYGIYPAQCIDNADPQGRGRIRAIIPAIGIRTEDQVDDDYWADACMTGLGTDPETGQSTGVFHPPDPYTNVWVQFQFGDPRFPVYIGGYMTTANVSDTFNSEQALLKGIRTKSGNFIRMSDDTEDLHLMICKGDGKGGPSPSFLSMSKEGHTTLTNDIGQVIYMNAEDNELSLLNGKKDGDTVETLSFFLLKDDEISFGTKSGGAYGIKGKNHTATGDNFVVDVSQQFAANAGTVMLGKGASEPAVRGMRLVIWTLLHQHLQGPPVPGTPTPINPAIPPPMLYNELSPNVFIS
jgi:hypothetical protein